MTDVIIVGDGPAGLAAAITLRQHGLPVVVMHRQPEEKKTRAGESLSSSALGALRELDLAGEFLAAGHPPCHGNASCWGSNTLAFADFIQSPSGQGWYVDRTVFNAMLRNRAIRSGVLFKEAGRANTLSRDTDGSWLITSENRHERAGFLIDASGRHNWLGRQLGLERIIADKQIAIIATYHTGEVRRQVHSMVEAVENGWWYVADAGEKSTVCMFFTDPDLHEKSDLLSPGYLDENRKKTTFVRHRIPASSALLSQPEHAAAGSSHLPVFSGAGWLAAGDAACAMDPLSSHGITFALRSGIDSALTCINLVSHTHAHSNEYNKMIQLSIQQYKEQRTRIYQMETRWPHAPFWQRRQLNNKIILAV